MKDLELELSKELQNTKRRQVQVKPPTNRRTRRSESNEISSNSCNNNSNSNSDSNSPQSTSMSSLEQMNATSSSYKVNPWTMIETFQLVENEESREEKKVKAVHKKTCMAAALHEQIRIKKKAAEEEKAEDDKFLKIQRNAIQEWEEEQVLAAKVEQEKIADLKKVRQQQVEETERKRKAQLDDKMSCELKEIEEIKLALEKEDQIKHQNKQLEREKWDRITAENMTKKKYRQQQKEEEARMDAKLMENMKIKYDNEERKRAKELEDRKIKLEVNGQLLSEAGAFNKREEMIKFEKSLLEAAEARERVQALQEKKKHDIERKKKDLIRETNEQMAQERRRREKEIEKENEAYALKCLKEKEALLEEEEADRIKQNETKEKYRRDLEDQMDEQRKHQAHFDGMTVVERSLNKKVRFQSISLCTRIRDYY